LVIIISRDLEERWNKITKNPIRIFGIPKIDDITNGGINKKLKRHNASTGVGKTLFLSSWAAI
jgi:hypothetical protein